MDLATIIMGVALTNVGVFLAGCTLATVRTWRERHAPGGRASGPAIYELRHAGRRGH